MSGAKASEGAGSEREVLEVRAAAARRALLASLRERARAFGRDAAPRVEGLSEDDSARKALALLAEKDLLAWTVPQRDGGADANGLCAPDTVSVRALCELRDELAWHSGMLDVMFVMQGLGSYPLAKGGVDALRKEYLPGVVRGRRIAAFALTEPDAGSSLGEVATRAEKTARGWRLNGAKTFISNAGIAEFYTVLARTSGAVGEGDGTLSMFLVPAGTRGLAIERFEVMAPHPIGEVRFSDVEVSADHLLGKEGGGLELALATLGRFRTSVAAAANGFARRALDESKARLASRKQFGKPLSTFQALRFDVAEMDVRLRASQLLVAEAADAVDNGSKAAVEVARAKLFATENASFVCDRAIQHFGGLGVKRGVIVERLYRDVRALRIYEGTSEIQKLVLAKKLFDAPRG
ncbi:MAG: acyl-CoA dehydrogenase family protein [Planctomycetes bacterium]|nr:acyl-CoA dehydrogenase family protein [Planctomycetota bacterium]